MRTSRLSSITVLFGAISSSLPAQTPMGWTSALGGPTARYDHAMAFDSQRNRTVLFGGSDGNYLGDTWEWNGTSWTQVSTTGPAHRYDHAMAYDSQRNRTVLFGGHGYGNPNNLVDTWEWDGTSWTQVSTTGPSARYDHAMAYDSQRNRTVLFGGYSGGYLGDTWEWDGASWTQVSTQGPSARYGHAMVYDSQRNRTVLFGGSDGNYLGDTWEWTGTAWQPQTLAVGPAARYHHAMAYDTQRNRTVLFSGRGNGGYRSDTWEGTGTTWTQNMSAGPSSRENHAMAYDSVRGLTLMFGGYNGNYQSDAWRFSIGGLASVFGSGCGNPELALTTPVGGRPDLGSTAVATVTNAPTSVVFISIGWSNTAMGVSSLPLHLDGYGLPGCYLLQSAEYAAVPMAGTGPGTATFSLAIPNSPSFLGLRMFLQSWAGAPGANAGNVIVSNGLEWFVNT